MTHRISTARPSMYSRHKEEHSERLCMEWGFMLWRWGLRWRGSSVSWGTSQKLRNHFVSHVPTLSPNVNLEIPKDLKILGEGHINKWQKFIGWNSFLLFNRSTYGCAISHLWPNLKGCVLNYKRLLHFQFLLVRWFTIVL